MSEDAQLGETREFWKLIEQGEKTRTSITKKGRACLWQTASQSVQLVIDARVTAENRCDFVQDHNLAPARICHFINSTERLRLISRVILRCRCAGMPVTRRGRILPLSVTNFSGDRDFCNR